MKNDLLVFPGMDEICVTVQGQYGGKAVCRAFYRALFMKQEQLNPVKN